MNEDKLLELLADLLFAYVNKDVYFPHDFEVEAVNNAADLLLAEYESDKYMKAFFEGVRMKNPWEVSE